MHHILALLYRPEWSSDRTFVPIDIVEQYLH